MIPAPDYCGYLCEPNSTCICLGGLCEANKISLGVCVSPSRVCCEYLFEPNSIQVVVCVGLTSFLSV